MPTLEELLKQVTEPKEWYKDVLKQCEKEILTYAHELIEDGYVDFTYSENVHRVCEQPLALYLSKELDARVTVKYNSDNRDGDWYLIKIERK